MLRHGGVYKMNAIAIPGIYLSCVLCILTSFHPHSSNLTKIRGLISRCYYVRQHITQSLILQFALFSSLLPSYHPRRRTLHLKDNSLHCSISDLVRNPPTIELRQGIYITAYRTILLTLRCQHLRLLVIQHHQITPLFLAAPINQNIHPQ